eukprot:m.115955 g.115955  ORF g.115955 m.115955 type:complete len:281 (-) comp14220_c0_seq3:125-967(-)
MSALHTALQQLAQESTVKNIKDTITQTLNDGSDEGVLRRLLCDALILNGDVCSETLLTKVDAALQPSILSQRKVQKLADLKPALRATCGNTSVLLWQGDITTLEVDAIVNAANDAGLGCFVPQHRCVDNVIHRASGPRLREACRTALAQRPPSKQSIPTGTEPLVTEGFWLPSTHVLHVTGPQISPPQSDPTQEEREQLKSCYRLCLEACKANGLRSIAFCCISTGLFGFRSELAAEIASTVVSSWLRENEDTMDCVIFNVYADHDLEFYKATIPTIFMN